MLQAGSVMFESFRGNFLTEKCLTNVRKVRKSSQEIRDEGLASRFLVLALGEPPRIFWKVWDMLAGTTGGNLSLRALRAMESS